MEEMMATHINTPNSTKFMKQSTKPATLSLREDSHSISKPKPKPKPKPKIRIVHIFAPEIIKTDAANFRELVQKLTGKSAMKTGSGVNKKKTMQVIKGEFEEEKERGNMWRVEENSGGYFSNLADFEGFFQGIGDYSSMLPLSYS